MSAAESERYARLAIPYNIGVALGYRDLIAIDRDTDEPDIVQALRDLFRAIYARGGIPVAKFGSKGCTSFFRWADAAPFRNRTFTSPAFGVMLELSGAGRSTTLPPSIHPKTGMPYTWRTARTLCDTRVDELPALTAGDVEAIDAALSPFMPPSKSITIRPRVSTTELNDRERYRQERYARALVERRTAELAAMPPESGRNRTAYNIACHAGKWVHHGIIGSPAVVDPIVRACEVNGLVRDIGRKRVIASIASGLRSAANDALPDLRANTQGGR